MGSREGYRRSWSCRSRSLPQLRQPSVPPGCTAPSAPDDLNCRPGLCEGNGRQEQAQTVSRRRAPLGDVMGRTVSTTFPNLSVLARTPRGIKTGTVNDWGAVTWSGEDGSVEATHRPELEIFDRVGGGDGFGSGLIYGPLPGGDLQAAVEHGAAHGARSDHAREHVHGHAGPRRQARVWRRWPRAAVSLDTRPIPSRATRSMSPKGNP